ncbi:hypothetical protein [Gracilimonas halophila]|uniref:Uncharacterized protein n=1 Tax=Gracilimonas halophila TaxID=1834464 RepID=A0ABW5JK53_9BACT
MHYSLITTFLIGGLMLLSLLAFNISLSTTTQETTLSAINQFSSDDIAQVLSNDFKRIGFNDDNEDQTFEEPVLATSDDTEIEFTINTTGSTIRWYADSTSSVPSTTNPDDFYLYREEDGTITSYFPVVFFEIKYLFYDNASRQWIETPDPENAKRFEVEFMLESGESIRQKEITGAEYHRTAWKRTFTPHNINKPW